MRVIKFLLIIAVIGSLGYIVWHRMHAVPPAGPQQQSGPTPVGVAQVIEKEIINWNSFTGRLSAIDRVEIKPRVEGTLTAIHFQPGQQVKKGDKLFTIDTRPYQAALNRANAALASAQSSLSLAKTQFDRAENLLKGNALSKSEFDQRKSAYTNAQAAVSLAQADAALARLNVTYATITAPIDGKIGRAEVTVGNVVDGGQNAPVLSYLVSNDPLYVEFDINEAVYLDYTRKLARKEATVTDLPVTMQLINEKEGARTGRIDAFDNQIDPVSGTMRVRAMFDNPDGVLVPGLFARVRLGGSPIKGLLINDEAINTDQDKRFVYVVTTDNKAEYREIKLGDTAGGLRVVTAGLQPGERIVVKGIQRVRPGAQLEPEMIDMMPTGVPQPEVKVPSEVTE